MVNYRHFGHVRSTCSPLTNTMDNVPGPKSGEYVITRDDARRTRRLRNEQKSLAFMKELIEKFSQPEELVVDLCSGTFSPALGCLLLSKYRKFIGCERDAECFSHARRHVFNRLAFEIQNGTPSFPITPELRDASREVLQCTGRVRELEVWKAPPR